MTTIEPYKNQFKINGFVYLISLILIFAAFCIFLYNSNVNLRYNISMKEKSSQNLESSNADLQNELYQILDIRNLDEFIRTHNLVQDRNPDYVEHGILANR